MASEGKHEFAWARYNTEVMQTACTWCGQQAGQRCKGTLSAYGTTPAHSARIKAAGYRWVAATRELVPLTN